MLKLDNITFPLYKLRSHLYIEYKLLGEVMVTSIRGIYIIDDQSLTGDLEERRAAIPIFHKDKKLYKLKERVPYLRQLVKYKSGTTFIDVNGYIFKYKKSSKLFNVESKKILRVKPYTNTRIVIQLEGLEQPFSIYEQLSTKAKYASIMYTNWGPFLYDITSKQHKTYKRKI